MLLIPFNRSLKGSFKGASRTSMSGDFWFRLHGRDSGCMGGLLRLYGGFNFRRVPKRSLYEASIKWAPCNITRP